MYLFIDPQKATSTFCSVIPSTNKLVVANETNLGIRRALNGHFLLDTVFQSVSNDTNALIDIDIPSEEVWYDNKHITMRQFSVIKL